MTMIARTRSLRIARMAAVAVAAGILTLAPVAIPAADASTAVIQCPTPAPTSGASGGGIGISAVVCGPRASGGSVDGGSIGGGSTGGFGSVGGGSGGAFSNDGSGSSGSGAGGGAGSPSAVAPTPTTPTVIADAVSLGGILSVGGLSTAGMPSVNPFSGDVQAWVTVRNTSQSTIDLTADFWMENLFGFAIATIDGVEVTDLKPGETRTVSADLAGAGQWTVLTTHVRINPPSEVDGTELSSLTRDSTAFVLPWLLVLFAGIGAAAGIAAPAIRREFVTPATAAVIV